jgi:hypothetical protein
LQLNPVLVVQARAEEVPLQLGIANAVGDAVALDALATTVLAASVANEAKETLAAGSVTVPLNVGFDMDGDEIVGEVANTKLPPDPVSSEIIPANWALVVEAN